MAQSVECQSHKRENPGSLAPTYKLGSVVHISNPSNGEDKHKNHCISLANQSIKSKPASKNKVESDQLLMCGLHTCAHKCQDTHMVHVHTSTLTYTHTTRTHTHTHMCTLPLASQFQFPAVVNNIGADAREQRFLCMS